MELLILGVGVFRNILQCGQRTLDLPDLQPPATITQVISALDALYQGSFSKELYLENGEENLWTRILLNGRDLSFLPEDKRLIFEGDSLLFSSVMAGG